MNAWTVGVDFGGTNIKVGLVSAEGRVLRELALPTRHHATPATFVEGVVEALGRLVAARASRHPRLQGVGVGAPGLVDVVRGVILELPNVPGPWRGVPLRRLLERRLRCPCAVDNDVNVVALGEWRCGAGQGSRDSVYVTLGTGIGGGVIIGGQLIRGASSCAGEIGHMKIALDGPRCACGRHGCLEAFIGTASVLRQARAAIRRGSRRLQRLAEAHAGRLTPELVCQAATAGDRAARQIWETFGHHLGLGLANVANLLNPERIIIGGGLANAWPLFIDRLAATVRRQVFEAPGRALRIVRGRLGPRAGIVGAAILVWDRIG